jgi:two-component system cell cycle sensor histidine kinase/response regulator CckA
MYESIQVKSNLSPVPKGEHIMPNMTGDKLAAELLRIRPDIPIILCTGYGEPLLEERVKNFGIKTFVMKPVLRSEMAKAIQDALGKKQDSESFT